MNDHFFEVRTFRGDRPSGADPTPFPTEDEAVVFANELKGLYGSNDIRVCIYEIIEIDY